MSSNGLQFTHSPSIDPLKRHCSVATIQSDPKGHFSTLIDQLRKQENFQNVLLQINNLSGNNLELLKFVFKYKTYTHANENPNDFRPWGYNFRANDGAGGFCER